MAEQLAQGRAPEVAVQAIRLGRLTALRKTGDQEIDIEDQSGETCHFSIPVCALDQSWLQVHCPRTTSFDGGES